MHSLYHFHLQCTILYFRVAFSFSFRTPFKWKSERNKIPGLLHPRPVPVKSDPISEVTFLSFKKKINWPNLSESPASNQINPFYKGFRISIRKNCGIRKVDGSIPRREVSAKDLRKRVMTAAISFGCPPPTHPLAPLLLWEHRQPIVKPCRLISTI